MRRKVALLLAMAAVLAVGSAHQQCGHCKRFRQAQQHTAPGWRIWTYPSSMASVTDFPLEFATKQASRLMDLVNSVPRQLRDLTQDNDGNRDMNHQSSDEVREDFDHPDCLHDHIGNDHSEKNNELDTQEPVHKRPFNLEHMSKLWKNWMEDFNDNMDWDGKWPQLNFWDGDKEDKREVDTKEEVGEEQGRGQFSEMVTKKKEMERKLAQDRQKIRQLEENIKRERDMQKQREEEKRLHMEREAERVRQEEQTRIEQERRRNYERLEREQFEMERQVHLEQERLRQLQQQEQLLRQQRLAEENAAANQQQGFKTKQAFRRNQGQAPNEGQQEQMNHGQFKRHIEKPEHKQQKQQQRQQQQQPAKSELFSLEIPKEYSPRDIKVKTYGPSDIKVLGKRICGCDENCVVKEFVRGFKLPTGVPSDSLKVNFFDDGHLSIQGATNQRDSLVLDSEVPVEPHGSFEDPAAVRERLECLKRKSGFKMSKMDKKTGQTHEEFKDTNINNRFDHGQISDVEDDGVTVEVVEE